MGWRERGWRWPCPCPLSGAEPVQIKLVPTDPTSPERKGAGGHAGVGPLRGTAMRGLRAAGTLNKHMTLSLLTGQGGHVVSS